LEHTAVAGAVNPEIERTIVLDVNENPGSVGCSIGDVNIVQKDIRSSGIGDARIDTRVDSTATRSVAPPEVPPFAPAVSDPPPVLFDAFPALPTGYATSDLHHTLQTSLPGARSHRMPPHPR
jgi:hypothetical protein